MRGHHMDHSEVLEKQGNFDLNRQRRRLGYGNGFVRRLRAGGYVAGPVESLAEVCARAIGITCLELRALLERRAAGRPVE